MKRIFTFGFLLMVFSLLNTTSIFAQPANDNVCDALELTLDGPAVVVNNLGGTAEAGEETIVPPNPTEDGAPGLCGPNGWCDGLLGHSMWFKFTAPATTTVDINICGSDFDAQVALYEVGECSDFSTFTWINASDDSPGCGIGDGLSGTFIQECLVAGQEYYIVVDDWQADAMAAVDTGDVVITVSTGQPTNQGVSVSNVPELVDPLCPGGDQGSVGITLINGVFPLTYAWSNGDATQDISGVPAGTYTVTITDFCGATLVAEYELDDPSEPAPITFGDFANGLLQPTHCGTGARGGQISLPVATGVGPFTYAWNDGDTTGFRSGLADGTYTVTITDGCDVNMEERTFYVGATAGPDFDLGATCAPTQIGIDNANAGGEVDSYTYNVDKTNDSGIACRSTIDGVRFITENDTWRAFDLDDDFGVDGEVTLAGIEVQITSRPNFEVSSGVPVKFTAYIANTAELDADGLVLIPLDSFETVVPAIDEYTAYFAPLRGEALGAGDVLAFRVSTTSPGADMHNFDFSANEIAVSPASATYITSEPCGITTPTALTSIGFNQQIIMDVFLEKGSGLTYQWDGPVDDATSATPMAMGTSSTTYNVTITDAACGTTFTDAVDVTCFTVSTENLVDDSFAITPNPSSGQFFMTNEGSARDMVIQVFDLQGKLVYTDNMNISNGETKSMNLDKLSKGIYLAKLSNENKVETHRLVIQ